MSHHNMVLTLSQSDRDNRCRCRCRCRRSRARITACFRFCLSSNDSDEVSTLLVLLLESAELSSEGLWCWLFWIPSRCLCCSCLKIVWRASRSEGVGAGMRKAGSTKGQSVHEREKDIEWEREIKRQRDWVRDRDRHTGQTLTYHSSLSLPSLSAVRSQHRSDCGCDWRRRTRPGCHSETCGCWQRRTERDCRGVDYGQKTTDTRY